MNPPAELITPFPYCASRLQVRRRPSREVMAGHIGIGGNNPIRIQSMTTSDTLDIEATVAQSIALAEVGCEIIRITAPNVRAAAALGEISKKLRAAGFNNPLVADIHFLPKAAMEAVEHVEKVRINPGNYADRKKFAVREYSDAQYEEELQRLYEAFTPIVVRCRDLGRAMRIGTNHGSLSDRIMNRYGDSPLGMVESAFEFIRIAESHGYRSIVLSMKASNPKVMVEAYRLAAARMAEEGMDYPLHLGVTEAGDGEDGRIKSAAGIGALLYDGLGDTIRVSLTEDSVYEIPVARDLAQKAMALWAQAEAAPLVDRAADQVNPYSYLRRPAVEISLAPDLQAGGAEVPRVLARTTLPIEDPETILTAVRQTRLKLKDTPLEGLVLPYEGTGEDNNGLQGILPQLGKDIPSLVLDLPGDIEKVALVADSLPSVTTGKLWLCARFSPESAEDLVKVARILHDKGIGLVVRSTGSLLRQGQGEVLAGLPNGFWMVTLAEIEPGLHALGAYRDLIAALQAFHLEPPLWVRSPRAFFMTPDTADRASRLLEASALMGGLLIDGYGDLVSFDEEDNLLLAVNRTYGILQGARARVSKTEFVACPSCGRTLFDLQSTTQKIRARTGHLKGVTIAIMGCIVNGPGEMADADFGYVGGAPGRVNLYIGKECVKFNIPEAEAVDRLVDLIRENGKWIEAETVSP